MTAEMAYCKVFWLNLFLYHQPKNTQGDHHFYSLTIRRRLNRINWTKLTTPAKVISIIQEMASRNVGTKEGLKYYDKNGLEVDEDHEHMADDVRAATVVPKERCPKYLLILKKKQLE